jgi:hypothetical protein
LSFRRLKVLLDGLPADSLWYTALRQRPDIDPSDVPNGIDAMRWGSIHDLLASLIDATIEVGWTLRQVNSKQRIPPPTRVPRPSAGPSRRRHGLSKQNLERVQSWRTTNRRKVTDGN